jgi:TetR/AcrR family acrAB operon transcriptional repressor
MMREAARQGQLPADLDEALATQAMHAYMVGIMHEWVLDPAAYDLAGAAPGFIDIFLGGLAAKPPRLRPKKPAARAAAAVAARASPTT